MKAHDFLESDYCNLQAEDGEIVASNIKTGNMKDQSRSGDVVCSGNLQGSIQINTKYSNVIGDRRLSKLTCQLGYKGGCAKAERN